MALGQQTGGSIEQRGNAPGPDTVVSDFYCSPRHFYSALAKQSAGAVSEHLTLRGVTMEASSHHALRMNLPRARYEK